MRGKRFFASMVLILMITALALPATTYAGGDQVNRPDGSGCFDGGQQAAGDAPEWAPRQQHDAHQ